MSLDRLYAAVAKLPEPYYDDGDGRIIYCADCRELLPLIEPESVDLVLTDPPYGIATDKYRSSLPDTKGRVTVDAIQGDNGCALAEFCIGWCRDTALVIWGARNWPHLLPHRGGRWWCWDKRCDERADKMLGSAFELAWDSRRSGFDRMIRIQHGGVVNADGRRFGRKHPTQKPVGVSSAILSQYKDAQIVLDPFLGSGTTLRACKDLGRCGIGIEIEEKYCDIAANRLAQKVLF